jgi:hypothetical protein
MSELASQTTGDIYADWDIDQLAATMADVLAADEHENAPKPADPQSFPPSPLQKQPICSGNEDSMERAVRCANPLVVRAEALSLR